MGNENASLRVEENIGRTLDHGTVRRGCKLFYKKRGIDAHWTWLFWFWRGLRRRRRLPSGRGHAVTAGIPIRNYVLPMGGSASADYSHEAALMGDNVPQSVVWAPAAGAAAEEQKEPAKNNKSVIRRNPKHPDRLAVQPFPDEPEVMSIWAAFQYVELCICINLITCFLM
jgi:hypothetical protein